MFSSFGNIKGYPFQLMYFSALFYYNVLGGAMVRGGKSDEVKC